MRQKSQVMQLPYSYITLTSELCVGKKLPGHNFKGSGFKFCLFIMCYWVKPWLSLKDMSKGKEVYSRQKYSSAKGSKHPDISLAVLCNSSYLHFSHNKDLSLQPELFHPLRTLWTKLPGLRSLFLTPWKLLLNKPFNLSVWNMFCALTTFNFITLYSGKSIQHTFIESPPWKTNF